MVRRLMNPAFAAAHGLANDPQQKREQASPSRIDLALKQARATGKLNLVHINDLREPLPNVLFDFRASIKVDLSMDSRQPLHQHTEETVTLVDLSDNSCLKGSSFDERFAKFERCQIMRFKECHFARMEVSLKSLERLTILDFSGNSFQSFDMDLLPPTLQELYLTNNLLKELHATSSDSEYLQLKVLDVAHNQLNECNISCPHLRNFQCHHNPFTELPQTILSSAREALDTIDMSNNRLRGPLDFCSFSNLKTLKLSMNRIGPNSPTIPFSLTRLDVTNNMITSIQTLLPDSSGTPSLFELMLHGNHLVELDASVIEKCINLQRLDLSSNKLKNLPYQLGLLPKIQTLRLTTNPLFTFKRSDVETNPNAILEVLRRRAPKEDVQSTSKQMLLSCVSNNHSIEVRASAQSRGRVVGSDLNKLVQELKASPQTALSITQKLSLRGFEEIPNELFALLPNVTHVDLSGNNLMAMPASLENSFPKLERLVVACNILSAIETFPSRPIWFNSLKHLDLSSNRLEKVPMGFLSELVVLETLNLSSNKLESIDNCTWLPSTLIQLELSENSIKDMEKLVWALASRCPKIHTLRISQNKVAKIPLVLGLFLEKSLGSLDLRFNPQQAIRHAILEKSCKDQLLYLKNRMTKGQIEAAMKQLGSGQSSEEENTPDSFEPPKPAQGDQMSSGIMKGSAFSGPHGPLVPLETTSAKERQQDSSIAPSPVNPEQEASLALIAQFKIKIQELQNELDNNFSLSQAKRYAVKKSLQMERSKMIREERKVGLRK